MPPQATWRMPAAHALAKAFVARRFRLVGVRIQPAQVIVVVAPDVVDDAEAQRAAEPLAPHAGVVTVAAAVADDDCHAADGLGLDPPHAAIGVVAAELDDDSHATDGRGLGQIVGVVAVAALGVDDHRDAQDRPALHGRLGRTIDVVAAQIDIHQQRPLHGHRAVVIGVLAAQVDHQGHVAQRIEIVGVGLLAADDDRAGRRLDLGDHVPGDARDDHVAAVRIVLQLIEQLRVGQRNRASAAVTIAPRSIFSIRSTSRRPVPRSLSVWATLFCPTITG